MKTKLLFQALAKYLAGILLFAVLLFLPAGTLQYPGGWLFCCLLFIPMLLLGIALLLSAPDLLKKRLQSDETETAQKKVVAGAALMFMAGFVAAGLDFRFGWTQVPKGMVMAAAAVLLLSYGMYAEVMRENAYLSRTVQIQQDQKVIDTGLYGVVRHPMYTATIFLFLSIPLVLGSLVSLAFFLVYPVLIIRRIRNEEAVLAEGLPGYRAYQQKVRYRLFPWIW